MNKFKGFTLIELAIVLVIISLIAGAGLGVTNGQIQSARISNTKQKQEAIRLALINYISRNNRLPCPAIATLAPGTAGYGAEVIAPGLCTGTIINGNVVATGIVPWLSLGLSEENGTDGYYNRFTYQVTLSATANMNSKTISGLKGAISTHTGTPVVLGAPATGNQSNDCAQGQVYNPCSGVVVIVSHGSNGSGAYNRDGTQIILPTGADELENTNNDSKFVIKDYSSNAANPFDDIVLTLSATDLLNPLILNGAFRDYMTVINDDVSHIKNAIIANAVFNKIIATTTTPATISYPIPSTVSISNSATSNADNLYLLDLVMKDPWGHDYIYNNSLSLSSFVIGSTTLQLRTISSGSNSNQQAFSIASSGPDGIPGNTDDIKSVIYVNDLQNTFSKGIW